MKYHKSGFTLIELSIVLVIIGLLVAGVLVAKDMIENSRIRSQISQLEKLRTSVNTFRGKYNALPGDMAASKAAAVGLYAPTGGVEGTLGFGDGNGLVDGKQNGVQSFGCTTGIAPDTADDSIATLLNGEPIMFFRHLSDAGLIESTYGTPTGTDPGNITIDGAVAVDADTPETVARYVPPAKLGGSITVDYRGPTNYFFLVDVQAAPAAGYPTVATSLTPMQVYNIDVKTDNGLPYSGAVQGSVAEGLSSICSYAACTDWAAQTYSFTNNDRVCAMMAAF